MAEREDLSDFGALYGHVCHLSIRIDAVIAAAIEHAVDGAADATAVLSAFEIANKVLAANLPLLDGLDARRWIERPPQASVAEAGTIFASLDDLHQDVIVTLVTSSLIRWRLLLRLLPCLAPEQVDVMSAHIANGSDAFDKLFGLHCLLSGADPDLVIRDQEAVVATMLAATAEAQDALDSLACRGGEPRDVISAADRYGEILPQRLIVIDLEGADTNPLRGAFEDRLRGWFAQTALSCDPDKLRHLWKAVLADAASRFRWMPAPIPARQISLTAAPDQAVRHATRILAMVHELHKAGYQRIRISPGISPSGAHWRCPVTYADIIGPDGFTIRGAWREHHVAPYSSSEESRYFGWPDAPGLSARELAVRFIERFPIIAHHGNGRDWLYAGWLTDILGRAEQGTIDSLPVFYADYDLPRQAEWLPPPP